MVTIQITEDEQKRGILNFYAKVAIEEFNHQLSEEVEKAIRKIAKESVIQLFTGEMMNQLTKMAKDKEEE